MLKLMEGFLQYRPVSLSISDFFMELPFSSYTAVLSVSVLLLPAH